jgi:mono/diheme cytochrome c family protein
VFVLPANLDPGTYTIASRATDAQGNVQSKTTEPNHRGYDYSGWNRLAVAVTVMCLKRSRSSRAGLHLPTLLMQHSHGFNPMRSFIVMALLVGTVAEQAHGSELGRQVLVELSIPQCALCHTLAAAGATGKIGPNLNQLKPTEDKVKVVVTQVFENMPAYGDMLSQDPIDAVSRFVAAVTGR